MRHLTGNDIALAQCAVQISISWWRAQPGCTSFKKDEMAKLYELNKKLGEALDERCPCLSDDASADAGSDFIYQPTER